MSAIAPFAARVVVQARAAQVVTAMPDSLEDVDPTPRPAPDPEAYVEAPAALYVYRQGAPDGSTHTGLVCEVAIGALLDGRVRGHEAVHDARVEGLVRHHATTAAAPALVSLLHRGGPAYTRTVEETCAAAPLLDFLGPGGLRQTVWRVPDGSTAAVTAELAAARHYIADGHHRAAAGLAEWRRAGEPADAGLLCVVHPLDGLRLSAFHRRVTGPVDPALLRELLEGDFDLHEVAEPPTPCLGTFGLYLAGEWFEVRYRAARADGLAGLDAAVLRDRVLERLAQSFGPTPRIETSTADACLDGLARQCDDDGGALFTLAPPSLESLIALADAGEVMPPKTTYFAPKPCAGIFLRP